ncbi:MAG: YfhO family protein [Gemmatimonadetes bacterium]|nr:YfhO family protein [Gemmatimonadota bacterium]
MKERIFDLWDAGLFLSAPTVKPLEVPAISDPTFGLEKNPHRPTLGRATLLNTWSVSEPGPPVLSRLFAPNHDPSRTTILELTPGAGAPPASPKRSPRPAYRVEYEAAPNSMRVAWQIGPAGMLSVLESWDPGWKATVNGEPAPIYRADFLFMAVPVPEGPCEVRFQYAPAGLRQGAGGTLLGVVGCGLILIFGRRRNGDTPS